MLIDFFTHLRRHKLPCSLRELLDLHGALAAGLASVDMDDFQGESVNILLNFTQFFETRIEYRFQIFTAHSCDFLLPSYARLA